jgi:hypothetical protein
MALERQKRQIQIQTTHFGWLVFLNSKSDIPPALSEMDFLNDIDNSTFARGEKKRLFS